MSGPTEAPGPGRVPQGGDPLTLLLVEDDRADAIIVEESVGALLLALTVPVRFQLR